MLNQFAHITVVLVITLALANLAITMMGLLATPYLARLTLVPYPAVGSVVIPIALVASFLGTLNWPCYPHRALLRGAGYGDEAVRVAPAALHHWIHSGPDH